MRKCNKAKNLMPLYVANDTTPEEHSLVETHLAGCPECRKELAGYQSAMGELKGLKNFPQTAEFWAEYQKELYDKIAKAKEQPVKEKIFTSPFRRIPFAIQTAAVLLISLTIGYFISSLIPYMKSSHPASPVEEAKASSGTIDNKLLGLRLQPASEALRSHLPMRVPSGGLVITGFLSKSFAQESGLKIGDVIVEVNGQPVTYKSRLPVTGVNKFKIIRQGKLMEINVNLTKERR